MNIIQVKSYKTSDGQIHESKVSALQREYSIEIRGLIQSAIGHRDSLTTTEVSKILCTESEKFSKIVGRYKKLINKESKAKSAEVSNT